MMKILLLIGLIIVASIIAIIALTKAKSKEAILILWIGYAIGMIITMIIIVMNDIPRIQNLEEKLNIYERSYEEFCLEDSLRQSDVYE